MQKITPFLWFDGKAEDAMDFYVSIFRKFEDFEGCSLMREEEPGPKGTAMSGEFEHEGQVFCFNVGPKFTFSPAKSFFVDCETQEEVDNFWEASPMSEKTHMRLAERQIAIS